MALDAGRAEGGVVRLEEHHADDVVADVALPLQLLGVVPLVRQLRGHVEHNLYRTPVCINGVKSWRRVRKNNRITFFDHSESKQAIQAAYEPVKS